MLSGWNLSSNAFKQFCAENRIADKKIGQLLAAVCTNNIETLKAAEEQVSHDPLERSQKILNAKDGNGFTALHYVASSGNCSTKRYLLDSIVDVEGLLQCLKDCNNITRANVTHSAMNRRCPNCVKLFIQKLPSQSIADLMFLQKAKCGDSPIVYAQKNWPTQHLTSLMAKIPLDVFSQMSGAILAYCMPDLLKLPLTPKQSAAIRLLPLCTALNDNPKSPGQVKKKATRVAAPTKQDAEGMHVNLINDEPQRIPGSPRVPLPVKEQLPATESRSKKLLTAVVSSDEELLNSLETEMVEGFVPMLLSVRDENGFTPFHKAAMTGNCGIIKRLLHCAADNERFEEIILDCNNISTSNIIHLKVQRKNCTCLKVLIEMIQDSHVAEAFFFCKDGSGYTPISYALKHWEPKELMSFMAGIPSPCFGFVQNRSIQSIPEFEKLPLTSTHLAAIYPLCNNFVIPKNQSLTRRNALICYSTTAREGAEEEAAKLGSALQSVNFTLGTKQWTLYSELETWLGKTVSQLATQSSVLFLAIMSHGFSGHIKGNEDSCGRIEDIIRLLRNQVPDHIPVVSPLLLFFSS